METRFLITRGDDDQRPIKLSTFEMAEDVAKAESLEAFLLTAYIKTAKGQWLATYRNGKLIKCDVDAVAKAMQ